MLPPRPPAPQILFHESRTNSVMSEKFVSLENKQIACQICRHVHAVHLRRIAVSLEVVTRPIGRGAHHVTYAFLHPRQRATDASPLFCWAAALLRLRH